MSEKQQSGCFGAVAWSLVVLTFAYVFWRGVILASTYTACDAILAVTRTRSDSALVRAAIEPTPATFVSGICPK